MQAIDFECSVDVSKAYEEEGKWIVEGFAATSDFDMQEDIISQQAIENSAKDLIENSTVLHNHNPNESIGKVEKSKAKKGGLWLKILVSKTAPELWQKIREGVLNKFSVRGKILQAKKQWIAALKKWARVIFKMHLLEVSLVAVPANPKAKALRWYIEKALDAYEEEGGELEEFDETEMHDFILVKGGTDMGTENDNDRELLEASGEPDPDDIKKGRDGKGGDGTDGGDDRKKASRGFPPAEKLWDDWMKYCEEQKLDNKSEADVWKAWVEFCKQRGYPSPAPYPKPAPERGTRMRQIVELVDKLLKEEKDEQRKKVLSQIREIARGASYAYPNARKDGDPGESGKEGDMEKAGRKMSTDRLTRLKKLLEELQRIISEVDSTKDQRGNPDDTGTDDSAAQKLDTLEQTVAKLIKTLGIGDDGRGGDTDDGKDDGKAPNLVQVIEQLSKRLDAIESVPAGRTSLDGQEPLAGEKGDGKSIWKGLV